MQLQDALKEKGFDARSALAQKMARLISPEELGRYKDMANIDKHIFRMKWASTTYANFEKGSRHEQVWKNIALEKGTYMSISMAFKKQGGTEADIQPTRKLVMKCYDMGSPWISWNWQTERYDVLVLKRGYQEEFEESWRMYTEHRSSGNNTSANKPRHASSHRDDKMHNDDAGAKGETPPDKKRKTKHDAPNIETKNPDAEDDKGEDDPGQRPSNHTCSLKAAMAGATKTKKAFQGASSAARNLVEEIQRDPVWSWANNDTMIGDLQSAQAHLDSELSSFDRKVIYQDIAAIKKASDPSTFAGNLLNFSKTLDPKIENLVHATTTLVAMHVARRKVSK